MIYGLLAEFDNPTDLVAAARQAHAAGYRNMDAYTPFPVEELTDAQRRGQPKVNLAGGFDNRLASPEWGRSCA